MKPIVAIVGRPNVGKSTFFNRITGTKKAIVEDRPGVTRDRIYGDAEWCGYNFTLIDTGGIELKSEDEMWNHIKKQAEIAIDTADVIIFMVSAKDGVTTADKDVADKLRRSKKPIVLVVNKLDNYKREYLYEFYELGLGEPIGVSAEQSKGFGDCLEEVCKNFEKIEEEEEEDVIKIAVVGKPNAGKSSLVNAILGYDRTIVSDISGTTRDAIDTEFILDGQKYKIIDTAGIRKKKAVSEDVEYYSVVRAFGAVRRADVCLAVVDSAEGLTEQDVKICGYIHEQGKPSVIVMNKWDKIEKDAYTVEDFKKKLNTDLAFMDYFKPIFISAKTGQRVPKTLETALLSLGNARRRITTGTLNDVINDAVRMNEPPSYHGKRLKIYYCVQDGVAPPTFVIFVNDSNLVHFSYKRYLENVIRKAFDFGGTPIRIFFRERNKEDGV